LERKPLSFMRIRHELRNRCEPPDPLEPPAARDYDRGRVASETVPNALLSRGIGGDEPLQFVRATGPKSICQTA